MENCLVDGYDATEYIRSEELGYFQSTRSKHKIPLELDDREYKKYFLKWLKLQNNFGIINQMVLYANCIDGITADVRISMLVECYEALGRKLEKIQMLFVVPESASFRNVTCPNCGRFRSIPIRGKKRLLVMYLLLLNNMESLFLQQSFVRRSLIKCIIKTRNKVFHVNSKQKKVSTGRHCGFYAVKLDWMFRYIIWFLMGYDRNKFNMAVSKEIKKFENEFPQLIY